MKVSDHFDKVLNVHVKQDSHRHEMPNMNKDFSLGLNKRGFNKIPGRQHTVSKDLSRDPIKESSEQLLRKRRR